MAIYTGSANLYTKFKLKLGQAGINFDTATFKVRLTASAHTPDQQNHEFADDLTNEVTGNGYAEQTVAVTWAQDGAICRLTVADPTFTASGGSIVFRRWHLILDTGNDATSPLIAYGYGDATPADITIGDTLSWSPDFSDVNGLFTI